MRIKGSHIPWIAALLAILVAKVESQNVKSQNVWPNPWPSGETTGWPNPRPKPKAKQIPYGKVQILESCYDCAPDFVEPTSARWFIRQSPISNQPFVEIKCGTWHPIPQGCYIANGKTLDDLTFAILELQKAHR